MVEKYLSETEIKKLLQCTSCKQVPQCPPIYMCKTGHHECSGCFVRNKNSIPGAEDTDASTDTDSDGYVSNHSCAICNEKITKTRNLFAECLLIHLESSKNENAAVKSSFPTRVRNNNIQEPSYPECCFNVYPDPSQRYDNQNMPVASFDSQPFSRFPFMCQNQPYNYAPVHPILVTDPNFDFSQNQDVFYPCYEGAEFYNGTLSRKPSYRRSKTSYLATHSSSVSLMVETSKRPIQCPSQLCGRTIAVASLYNHFCFDHPDVPSISVDFEVGSHLILDPELIPFNYGRCVALLLIPNRSDGLSVNSPNLDNGTKYRHSFPLLVMASKLECNAGSTGSCVVEADEEESHSDKLNHGDFQVLGSPKTSLLVVWLAGVEASSSLVATIQVTEKQSNLRTLIYTGPVMSLRYNQTTNKVFEQGDCLVIHPGILDCLTESDGFNLQIIVH